MKSPKITKKTDKATLTIYEKTRAIMDEFPFVNYSHIFRAAVIRLYEASARAEKQSTDEAARSSGQ